ncbi:MAG: 8-oxoguanine DNA glycosylase [Acidiphilium sp.]
MTVDIINQTIRAMCLEIKAQASATQNWQLMAEEEFLYEAAICIFGSQMVYEMAVATADRLREKNLLQPAPRSQSVQVIERMVVEALSGPLPVPACDGTQRWVRPRFKNRLASLLAKTVVEIYGQSRTIRGFLFDARDAREARETLIQHVWGFGPKQASLFLRRVGYCADLAVLDVHVLDYLQLAHGLSLSPNKLGRLSLYEEIEDTFREISAEFGHSMGCVDLATWLTMRVAKREAFL